MSNLFVHKRYIRIRKSDSSLVTFTSTNDAILKSGPKIKTISWDGMGEI